MPIFKSNTIGQYIVKFMGVFAVIMLLGVYTILYTLEWRLVNIVLALIVASIVLSVSISRFNTKVLASYNRALLHIEAIKLEDYNLHTKSEFKEGVTAELHQELTTLSKQMQAYKSQYDQHALLLYQLIDQLDTPMMVFNQKQKLTYANSAFTILYNQPWQMFRFSSPTLLGLAETAQGWQLVNNDRKWHLSQSDFIDDGERHTLLVFTNIDSAIRASQLSAWQQIIRVLGHEIRNSLTPVSSLAESLASTLNSPRQQKALAIIGARCDHLQDFVERYSALSQSLNLNIQMIDLSSLTQRLQGLFADRELRICAETKGLWADAAFIEQVLINLIKNAYEANASTVDIRFSKTPDDATIHITDNGHGLANTANLFVPLFTTKPDGQGIGLSFCQNIIEQHHGKITLKNNTAPQAGMTATISLPQKI